MGRMIDYRAATGSSSSGGGGTAYMHIPFYVGLQLNLGSIPNSEQYFANNASYRTLIDTTDMNYVRVLSNIYKTNTSPNDPRFYPQYSTDGGSTWITIGAGTTASGDAVPHSFGMRASNWIPLPSAAKGSNIGFRIAQNGGDSTDTTQVGHTALEFKS